MEVYSTEEQQIESIKKWWKENGTSVVVGVAIGLGGVLGWKAWNEHRDNIGEQASVQFVQLMSTVASGNYESAAKQVELIKTEFESTTYAAFAALVQARVKFEQGDSIAARKELEWVLANAPNPGLAQIARLRLARVLVGDGEPDAAANLLSQGAPGGFSGEYAELEGDIALARGDHAAAREAYLRALGLEIVDTGLVQMKLDNLPVAAKPAVE